MDHEQANVVGNVVECTISICERNARVLFGSGSTQSFVAPQFACDIRQPSELLPLILLVTTPVGKRVACENYYPKCSMQIRGLFMTADLVVLSMHDLDVIFGMDWLTKLRACVDCFHKAITFKVDEPSLNVIFEGVWKRKPSNGLVSALDAEKLGEASVGHPRRGYRTWMSTMGQVLFIIF